MSLLVLSVIVLFIALGMHFSNPDAESHMSIIIGIFFLMGYCLLGGYFLLVALLDEDARFVQQLQPSGLAVRAAAQQLVARGRDFPGERFDLQMPLIAAVAVARVVHAHLAARVGGVGDLVVVDPVDLDGQPRAAQLGATL